MKPGRDLTDFMDRLGHDFSDPALLQRALTHSSLSSPTRPDNQRLEFLGDRVLGLVMAEAVLADIIAAGYPAAAIIGRAEEGAPAIVIE